MKVTRTVQTAAIGVLVAGTVLSFDRWVLARGQAGQGAAQAAATPVAKLVADPASLSLRTGESVPLKIIAYDAAGKPIPDAIVRVSMAQ